jgi:hypothetical protein
MLLHRLIIEIIGGFAALDTCKCSSCQSVSSQRSGSLTLSCRNAKCGVWSGYRDSGAAPRVLHISFDHSLEASLLVLLFLKIYPQSFTIDIESASSCVLMYFVSIYRQFQYHDHNSNLSSSLHYVIHKCFFIPSHSISDSTIMLLEEVFLGDKSQDRQSSQQPGTSRNALPRSSLRNLRSCRRR